MIRRKSLEIVLSRMMDVPTPKVELEQYRTPSPIVAEIAFLALENGSVDGRRILELGCGGAPFLVAAGALGALTLKGIDIDPVSIGIAWENIKEAGRSLGIDLFSRTEVIERDVSGFDDGEKFDTVFMNPPFGAQKKGADRPFLESAFRTGAEVYSLHNAKGISFVRGMIDRSGYQIVCEREYRFELPHRYAFHTKERTDIVAVMIHSKPEMTNLK